MTNQKVAFITGITGQDGSYLVEFLLKKKYIVHGLVRRSSTVNTSRINHLFEVENKTNNLHLHYGDLQDVACIQNIILTTKPDEVYNLAAQSHVRVSFDAPIYTADIDALGTLRMLETIKNSKKDIKFYQASSSEMFGKVQEIPQSETTPFYPRSPYGVSKVFSYWATVNYRESYGIFATNGILFNHESPRRGETFVTRKITRGLKRILAKKDKKLYLGNLNSKRDWGYAPDYVEAMWMMLQANNPGDYVVATGETHTVREFVEESAKLLGMQIVWKGTDLNEVGIDKKTGNIIIEIDPIYFRPTEVDLLIGNAKKIHNELGWKPKTTFKQLVKIMIESEQV